MLIDNEIKKWSTWSLGGFHAHYVDFNWRDARQTGHWQAFQVTDEIRSVLVLLDGSCDSRLGPIRLVGLVISTIRPSFIRCLGVGCRRNDMSIGARRASLIGPWNAVDQISACEESISKKESA